MKTTIFLIFLSISAIRLNAQKNSADASNFVVSPLSYAVADERIGITIYNKDFETILSSSPLEYRLAYSTGYLFAVSTEFENSEWFKSVKKLFKKNNCVSFKKEKFIFFMPKIFNSKPEVILSFLDGYCADELSEKILNFYTQDSIIKKKVSYNVSLLKNVKNKSEQIKTIEKKITSTTLEIENINKRIAKLNADINSFSNKALVSQIVYFKSMYLATSTYNKSNFKYNPDNDFLRKYYEKNYVSLDGLPYDPSQVNLPYIHKEMYDAIERMYKSEKELWNELGLGEFVIISASRTFIKQYSEVANENPAATGMFSSGHSMGVCVDIGGNIELLQNDKKWKEANKRLAKFGLRLNDNIYKNGKIVPDRNHLMLTKFYGDRNGKGIDTKFSLELINTTFQSNYDEIIKQNFIQAVKKTYLSKELLAINKNISRLDKVIQEKTEKYQNLDKSLTGLKGQENQLKTKLNRIITEYTILQSRQRKQNINKRDAWGESDIRDSYWNNVSDPKNELYAPGERTGPDVINCRAIECRPSERDSQGIERRELPPMTDPM